MDYFFDLIYKLLVLLYLFLYCKVLFRFILFDLRRLDLDSENVFSNLIKLNCVSIVIP